MTVDTDRIELFPGWAFVRCTDESSAHFGEWFIEDPQKVWVAKFWDGPQAGEEDCHAFAHAIHSALKAAREGKVPPVARSLRGEAVK